MTFVLLFIFFYDSTFSYYVTISMRYLHPEQTLILRLSVTLAPKSGQPDVLYPRICVYGVP